MRLEGDAEQTSPDDGVIDTVRLTVPWNPLIRVAVIVEFPKDPDFYARILQVCCWTCGRVTTHGITFRCGGRCFLCKECGNIVVEKL